MLFVVGSQRCTGRNVWRSSCCTIRIRSLFDAELGHYLDVTADDIKNAVAKFVNVENRVVLDIIPASDAQESS